MEKKRIFYLDFLKAIAIYAVIINHMYVHGYNNLDVFTEGIFSFIRGHFTTIHLPLFLMISGAVTLNKTIKIKEIIKLILRIIVFCIVFQIVFKFLSTIYKNETLIL